MRVSSAYRDLGKPNKANKPIGCACACKYHPSLSPIPLRRRRSLGPDLMSSAAPLHRWVSRPHGLAGEAGENGSPGRELKRRNLGPPAPQAVDAHFLESLLKIRRKDPAIYRKETVLFPDVQEGGAAAPQARSPARSHPARPGRGIAGRRRCR